MKKYLTPELFVTGLGCTKKMFLQASAPGLSEEHQSIICYKEVGEFKKVVCEFIDPNVEEAEVQLVQFKRYSGEYNIEMLKTERISLADLYLDAGNCRGFVDLAISHGARGIDLYQIFPSTEIKDVHVYKCVYLLNLAQTLNLKINNFYIVHLNKDYKRDGALNENLITIRNLIQPLRKLLPRMQTKIAYFNKVLTWNKAPEKEIDLCCFKPELCSFRKSCWKPEFLQADSIFQMRSMKATTKLGYYYREIKNLPQLLDTNSHRLNEVQIVQASSVVDNKIACRIESISEWMRVAEKHTEILFLDFEAFAPIIPVADKLGPYSRIPFQFSMHSLNLQTGVIRAFEFLGEPKKDIDTRLAFLKGLMNSLAKCHNKCPIIVYNRTFENAVLSDLQNQFPDYSPALKNVRSRLYDMMTIFKEKWYFDPRFDSYKLKTILPILCPDLTYATLQIQNGSSAISDYRELLECSGKEEKEIRKDLLEYCNLDTLALVRIFQFLQNLIRDNQFNNLNSKTCENEKVQTQTHE